MSVVPNSRDEHAPRLDVIGTLLVTPGLITLLYGVIEGPGRGWTDPLVLAAFTVAVVLLVCFVLWERRVADPILDVSFFNDPRFTAASIAITLVFFAMFGALFFVSQYLQFVLGYSALKSGAALIPVAIALMVAAPSSAGLVRGVRFEDRRRRWAADRRRGAAAVPPGPPRRAATRSSAPSS